MMGSMLIFTSSCKKTVTDIDGNEYKIVKIGDQIWMTENLKVTKYNNGDLIETTIPDTLNISEQTTPEYQWAYNSNDTLVAKLGRLYTWFVVTDSRKICPAGWHVATDAEWSKLIKYFGGEAEAGGKLKESGLVNWVDPNAGATNSSGFTTYPSGGRASNGVFGGIGYYGAWWSPDESDSTLASYWYIYYNNTTVKRTSFHKNSGFSVRCVSDK